MAIIAILRYYRQHLETLMIPFWPIQDDIQTIEDIKNRKYRLHYLFPLLMSILLLIDMAIQYNFHWTNDLSKSTIFMHIILKTMPEFFRLKNNTGHAAVFSMILFCNGCLLFETSPHVNFILLKAGSNLVFPYRKPQYRYVNRKLAQTLISFNVKYRKFCHKLMNFLNLQLDFAFAVPLIILEIYQMICSNFRYVSTLRTVIYILICPFFFRTLGSCIHIGIQFIAQNYFIQIKQRHYLMQIGKYFRKLTYQKQYSKFLQAMGSILDLTREIGAFDRFYSKYITGEIILLGVLGSSVLNVTLTAVGDAPLYLSMPWILYSGTFFAFVLLFNVFSSRTNCLNLCLFKQARQLQIRLLSRKSLSRYQIVKLDLINEYKMLLQKCSFRLVNSAMINNKLFAFQIFGMISVFYMKLISEDSWV